MRDILVLTKTIERPMAYGYKRDEIDGCPSFRRFIYNGDNYMITVPTTPFYGYKFDCVFCFTELTPDLVANIESKMAPHCSLVYLHANKYTDIKDTVDEELQ